MSDVAADLPTDTVVDGQTFTFAGFEPYTCRDGRTITLYRWRSECDACDAPYEISIPSTRAELSPSRHCADCRKLGSKAGAEKRRRQRAAVVRAAYEADPSLEAQWPNGLPDWWLDPSIIR